MSKIRFYSISVSWLPAIAVAAWWAGFVPFPTRPESVGIQRETMRLYGAPDDEALYLTEKLVPLSAVNKPCETTFSLTPQAYASKTGEVVNPEAKDAKKTVCWPTLSGVPFFGWGSPHWLLATSQWDNTKPGGGPRTGVIQPYQLFRSYAACMWAKRRVDAEELESERWNIEHSSTHTVDTFDVSSCEAMP
jgi:hypothetical protein